MIPVETLTQWQTLTNNATPGPWGVALDEHIVRNLEMISRASFTCTSEIARVCDEDEREQWNDDDASYVYIEPKRDADFIAAARTAMPQLLDGYKQLLAANAQLQAELDAASAVFEDTIVLPSTAKTLCSDIHTEPGIKGLFLCRLDPGHDGDHQGSSGKTWPVEGRGVVADSPTPDARAEA